MTMRVMQLKRKDRQTAATLLLARESKQRMNLIQEVMIKMKVKKRMVMKMMHMKMP
jgi:hypothetical protein